MFRLDPGETDANLVNPLSGLQGPSFLIKRLRYSYLLAVGTVLLLITVLSAGAFAKNGKYYETFSNVRYMEAVESRVGTELTLEESGECVVATLKDYEGAPGVVQTRLKGTLHQMRVHLSGTGKRGRVEISGKIGVADFRGTITRWIGSDKYEEPVILRRRLKQDTCCPA